MLDLISVYSVITVTEGSFTRFIMLLFMLSPPGDLWFRFAKRKPLHHTVPQGFYKRFFFKTFIQLNKILRENTYSRNQLQQILKL